ASGDEAGPGSSLGLFLFRRHVDRLVHKGAGGGLAGVHLIALLDPLPEAADALGHVAHHGGDLSATAEQQEQDRKYDDDLEWTESSEHGFYSVASKLAPAG